MDYIKHVYNQFITNDNDVVGMVSYCKYEQGRFNASDSDPERYYAASSARIRIIAEEGNNFVDNYVRKASEEQIKKLEKEVHKYHLYKYAGILFFIVIVFISLFFGHNIPDNIREIKIGEILDFISLLKKLP